MRYYYYLLVLPFLISCTNVDIDAVNSRWDDNKKLSDVPDLDPPGTNSFSFAVMGDTHVGNPDGDIFREAVEDASNNGAAFVVVAGDISDNGEKGQFTQFVNILNENSMEYRVAIGNHDIFFNGWKHYRKIIGKSIYSIDADNVHLVFLDSANGTFGVKQLEWLEKDLKNSSARHTIVITHFPPWVGNFSSLFKLSSEEEASIFKDILYRYNVDYMFSAHYHGYQKTKIGKTTYIVSGGANGVLDPGEFKHYIRVTVNGNDLKVSVRNL